MKSRIVLALAFILPTLSFGAPAIEPSDRAQALQLAKAAHQELDRSQNEVLRRGSERSACNILGRLMALYSSRDENVTVTYSKKGSDGKPVPETNVIPVPRFDNPNVDAIGICRPNSLWARKPSMTALAAEIARLSR